MILWDVKSIGYPHEEVNRACLLVMPSFFVYTLSMRFILAMFLSHMDWFSCARLNFYYDFCLHFRFWCVCVFVFHSWFTTCREMCLSLGILFCRMINVYILAVWHKEQTIIQEACANCDFHMLFLLLQSTLEGNSLLQYRQKYLAFRKRILNMCFYKWRKSSWYERMKWE